MKSRVAGPIGEVAFQEGQTVTKGQLLFQIDRDTLQREAAEREADIERDVAMEEQARAMLDRDTSTQKQSLLEANNGAELEKEGILSRERAGQLPPKSMPGLQRKSAPKLAPLVQAKGLRSVLENASSNRPELA